MVLGDGVGGPKKENGPETPSPWIIIALNNGSYIVMDNGVETLYGDAYSIKDEAQKKHSNEKKTGDGSMSQNAVMSEKKAQNRFQSSHVTFPRYI